LASLTRRPVCPGGVKLDKTQSEHIASAFGVSRPTFEATAQNDVPLGVHRLAVWVVASGAARVELLRAMLLQAFYGIRSERQPTRRAALVV